MDMDLFIEITLVIIVTTLLAGLMRSLKQPLIISYIISGILIGPYFLNVIRSTETMTLFSHIGIALVLFIVGLRLSPKIMRDVGRVSLIAGIGQILFTSLIGFFIGKFLGFSTTVSIYVAIALTFSSTIIIMKLLTDKKDTNTLYGKIATGFLIVQDLVAVLILMIIPSISEGLDLPALIFETIFVGVGLFVLLLVMSLYALPKITNYIAKSQELLLLFSICWCLSLASLFHHINFSMGIGALLAGVTLSLTPHRYEISSKMKPLRDFFIVLFFIFLGSQMAFADISHYIIPIIIFSAFIFVGNPLIVMILMGLLGYTKRNSFLAGLTVAQISEFSLLIIMLGISVGHLTNEILSFVTAIGLITIAGSAYMILYANKIYPHLSNYLRVFERKGKKVDEHKYNTGKSYDIVLFGCDRLGHFLLKPFKKIKKKFLVVDNNPEIISNLAKNGIHCRYGDADNNEMLDGLNLQNVKMVISTVPDIDINLFLIYKLKRLNKKAILIIVSHGIDETKKLYDEGATYAIMPHFAGGNYFSTLISEYELDLSKFLKERAIQIKYLKEENTW
jgi:Kef-type K+ transport system membrane component KefB